MKLVPLGDRVVLKQTDAEEVTASGIVLASQSQEKPMQGTVVAVGPGGMGPNGEKIEMTVKVGDTVVYTRFGGNNVKVGEEEFVIVRQDDILAVVE